MSVPATTVSSSGPSAARFEPYFRLVRSLLPRASSLAVFSAAGELLWSSDTMTGPDLMNVVEDALIAARSSQGGAGQLRTLEGNLPVYLCSLRDEAAGLLAMVAVVCRPTEGGERKNQDFSFANALLAPALESLRREFLAQAAIEELHGTVAALNRDLELLLSHGALDQPNTEGANDLQLLLQQTMEHLRAGTGALLVPEKNLTLLRSAGDSATDARFMMKAHRKLMTLAQAQAGPLMVNDVDVAATDTYPYRVLCCALRTRAGRCIGMLALLREEAHERFSERDAHLVQILARKALDIVESSYDSLSGLYTRPAFERRLSAVVTDGKAGQPWSALYIDVDQLHAINEKAGMHVGDSVLGQLGELFRKRLPPGASARASRAIASRCCCRRRWRMPRNSHRRCASGPSSSCRSRASRVRPSRSASAWHCSTPATGLSSPTCWRRPKAPARQPRTAAATASRSTSRATPRSCDASPTSRSPRSCATPSTMTGCGSMRS